jgi:MFS superfamily sulfate permease-like transporter
LGVGASRLKEVVQKCRQEFRNLSFKASLPDQDERRFYLAEDFPEELKDDGVRWRLQVGNGLIAEEAVLFSGGGAVVGHVPRGLPGIAFPHITVSGLFQLLPMALVISLLGFMEAISIAKAMATRTGQTVDPNQELIGQGLANIAGAMTGGYPVSGSFSRSAVNLQAGAVTGMSNVFSSVFVLLTLLFLTPLLYYLPQPVLAAIIMMAVLGLVNVRGFVHAWRAKWYDGAIAIITFLCTLFFAPHLDTGIMIGVVLSIGLHLFRDMRPSIALLAMHPDGTYRNRARFKLAQCRHIAVIRYQGSLIFANVSYLEECVLEQVAKMPELKHILIVGNGINELDASGEDMLSVIVDRLIAAGYQVSFSGLNDSVMDTMRHTGIYRRIGDDHFYRNVTRAIDSIWPSAHIATSETAQCPLIIPVKIDEGSAEESKTTAGVHFAR